MRSHRFPSGAGVARVMVGAAFVVRQGKGKQRVSLCLFCQSRRSRNRCGTFSAGKGARLRELPPQGRMDAFCPDVIAADGQRPCRQPGCARRFFRQRAANVPVPCQQRDNRMWTTRLLVGRRPEKSGAGAGHFLRTRRQDAPWTPSARNLSCHVTVLCKGLSERPECVVKTRPC